MVRDVFPWIVNAPAAGDGVVETGGELALGFVRCLADGLQDFYALLYMFGLNVVPEEVFYRILQLATPPSSGEAFSLSLSKSARARPLKKEGTAVNAWASDMPWILASHTNRKRTLNIITGSFSEKWYVLS